MMDQAVWDQVTAKFVATIKRLEDKIEIDRKNLLSYKKEQQRHNLKLTNSNKRLREEKQMMGEQAMDLQNTTKILNKMKLRSSPTLPYAFIGTQLGSPYGP